MRFVSSLNKERSTLISLVMPKDWGAQFALRVINRFMIGLSGLGSTFTFSSSRPSFMRLCHE
jgi:hypothetical protein